MKLWIHPFLEYVFLAAGLSLCTYLFVSLKQELQRLNKRQQEAQQALAEVVEKLRSELAAVQGAMAELDERTAALPQFHPPKPSMNTSRRSQVLRMHRRGDRPEQIAAALNLPQNEVDLLLKLHQARPGPATAQPGLAPYSPAEEQPVQPVDGPGEAEQSGGAAG